MTYHTKKKLEEEAAEKYHSALEMCESWWSAGGEINNTQQAPLTGAESDGKLFREHKNMLEKTIAFSSFFRHPGSDDDDDDRARTHIARPRFVTNLELPWIVINKPASLHVFRPPNRTLTSREFRREGVRTGKIRAEWKEALGSGVSCSYGDYWNLIFPLSPATPVFTLNQTYLRIKRSIPAHKASERAAETFFRLDFQNCSLHSDEQNLPLREKASEDVKLLSCSMNRMQSIRFVDENL